MYPAKEINTEPGNTIEQAESGLRHAINAGGRQRRSKFMSSLEKVHWLYETCSLHNDGKEKALCMAKHVLSNTRKTS